jgi:hypothetical protein
MTAVIEAGALKRFDEHGNLHTVTAEEYFAKLPDAFLAMEFSVATWAKGHYAAVDEPKEPVAADDPKGLLLDVVGDNLEKNLMAIAAEDFAAFRKILADLQSGDPRRHLDALSEIVERTTGAKITGEDLQYAIEDMNYEERVLLAQKLSEATGRNVQEFWDILEEIASRKGLPDFLRKQGM